MSDLSPIFALEAEQLLLDNEYEEAIELCNKGIEEYPYYPAAYAVLAQAHFEKDNIEASKNAIERGLSLFPNDTKLNRIKNDIDSKGDNSTLYKKPNKKDLENLENEIFQPEEVELEEEDIYKPDFNKFLEVHSDEGEEKEEEITEKVAYEHEAQPEEPEPDTETESDETEEQLSDDDIDDLFNEQAEESEPDTEPESDVTEEQLSDDDIDDLFNEQAEEPEPTTEPESDESEEQLSDDDIDDLFNEQAEESEPDTEPESDETEEQLSDDDIDDLFNEQPEEPEPTTEPESDESEEQLSDDDIDDLFSEQAEEPEPTTEPESDVTEGQLSDDDIDDMFNKEESKEEELTSESQLSATREEKPLAEEYTPAPEELHADNLSIIPGLETNPLMIREEPLTYHTDIESMPDYPPFSPEQPVENDKGSQILMNIARQLEEVSTVKTSYDREEQDKMSQNGIVASETMANIYIQQGVISKAIQVYEVLADQEDDPGKKEKYLEKIDDLKSGGA